MTARWEIDLSPGGEHSPWRMPPPLTVSIFVIEGSSKKLLAVSPDAEPVDLGENLILAIENFLLVGFDFL